MHLGFLILDLGFINIFDFRFGIYLHFGFMIFEFGFVLYFNSIGFAS